MYSTKKKKAKCACKRLTQWTPHALPYMSAAFLHFSTRKVGENLGACQNSGSMPLLVPYKHHQ